jgi:hypothetical protein
VELWSRGVSWYGREEKEEKISFIIDVLNKTPSTPGEYAVEYQVAVFKPWEAGTAPASC